MPQARADFAIDIARVRADTPACEQVLHFNNAGAALPPQRVVDAVIAHILREAQIGGYEAEAEAAQAIEGAYDAVAALLNCARDEIALVENATRAWDMAFYAFAARLRPGDRILTAETEYASNFLAFLQVAGARGVRVETLPSRPDGSVDVQRACAMLDERVRLVALTHVPTNGGIVQPAAAIGRVTRERGIAFLLDACQSIGQFPIDVQEIGCDMLSATGRKYLRGPRGTGFLYVRREWIERLEPPFIDLHAATWLAPDRYRVRSDARRFENWESHVAGRVGLGVAVRYALDVGLAAIEHRVTGLADRLREGLSVIPGVVVHDLGAPGSRCGIVSFTRDHETACGVRDRLRSLGINVSVSGASSTLLDMRRRGLAEVVRASVHYYNTETEIERFCAALRDDARRPRATGA